MTVDFSNGKPIPPTGLFFNGGGETLGDNLVLVGANANTVTQSFTANGDGTINIDGSLITYTSSEATDDDLVVQNRIYSFTGGAETITLANSAAIPEVLSGWQLVDSSTTLAATTATTFANLTPGNGTLFNSGDVLNISGSDAGGAVATSFTISSINTTTLGDLITALSAAFTASTASLNSGVIVITANATGNAAPVLALAITADAGNSGNSHPAPLGLFDVFEQGTTGVNELLLDSTLSDAVRFTNPAVSLTIQTTAGSGADVIQVNSLPSALGAALTIDGKAASDQTLFSSSLNVNSLAVSSSLIELGGNITTAATGAVTLSGLVRLVSDVTIDTSAGGGSDITVNGAIVAGVADADISFDAGAAGNINVTGGITSYYQAVGGVVVGEGEFFTSRLNNGTDNFEIISVETAPFPGLFSNSRGLGYVQVLPDGSTGAAAPPNGPPAIDYRIRITTADTYRLFLRTVGFDGGSDSIYASIVEVQDGAGGVPDYYRVLTAGNSNFASPHWQTAGAVETTALTGTNVAMNWTLTPGEYTVRIVNREDGVALDAFVLQPSSLAAPSGTGPAANGFSVGDVVVASANNVSFGDAVIAASFTQNTGVGTTTFDDAAIVSGAFDIDNATVVATSGLVADTARIAFSSGSTGSVTVTGHRQRHGNDSPKRRHADCARRTFRRSRSRHSSNRRCRRSCCYCWRCDSRSRSIACPCWGAVRQTTPPSPSAAATTRTRCTCIPPAATPDS